MLQTLPRRKSLDSDTDGSMEPYAGPAVEADTANSNHFDHNRSAHITNINGECADSCHMQDLELEARGCQLANENQTAPKLVQDEARLPSLASRMLTPFAAFALQTRSGSHASISQDHDGVT